MIGFPENKLILDSSRELPNKPILYRNSSGSYTNSAGFVPVASQHILRREFDRDGNNLGFLLEPRQTAHSYRAFAFTNSPGGSNGASWGVNAISAGASTLPDVFGTNFACEAVLHDVGGWDSLAQYNSLVAGETYTWSCYVKLGTATNFAIMPNDTTNWDTLGLGRVWTYEELSTTKWTRVYVTFTANSTGQCNLHIGKHEKSLVTQQTAGTIYMCGHQFEKGDMSSFIENGVTRERDYLTANLHGTFEVKKTSGNETKIYRNQPSSTSAPYEITPILGNRFLKRMEIRRTRDPLEGVPVAFRLQTHMGDSNTYGMWQDTAKTIPAVKQNDPVRVWTCGFTGKDVIAPNDAARPLLKFRNGIPVLDFDGIDDKLVAGNYGGTVTYTAVFRSKTTVFNTYWSLIDQDDYTYGVPSKWGMWEINQNYFHNNPYPQSFRVNGIAKNVYDPFNVDRWNVVTVKTNNASNVVSRAIGQADGVYYGSFELVALLMYDGTPTTDQIEKTENFYKNLYIHQLDDTPTSILLKTHGGDNIPSGMWQDLSKTTPAVSNGHRVRVWENWNNTTSYAAVAVSDATRPTLRFSNGHPVLEFDESGRMEITGAISLFTTGASACIKFEPNDTNYTILSTEDYVSYGSYDRNGGNAYSYPHLFRLERIETYRVMPTSGIHTSTTVARSGAWQNWLDGVPGDLKTGAFGIIESNLIIGQRNDAGGFSGYLHAIALSNYPWTPDQRIEAENHVNSVFY